MVNIYGHKWVKLTFTAILKEIVHLMNLCLHHSTFPTELKKAVIKPIYKAGDKQLFNNYRPISLLPVISKLLEKNNLQTTESSHSFKCNHS